MRPLFFCLVLISLWGCGGPSGRDGLGGGSQPVTATATPTLFEQRAITLAEERLRLETETARVATGWATRDGLLQQLAGLALADLQDLLPLLSAETGSERTRVLQRFDQRREFLLECERRLAEQLRADSVAVRELFAQEIVFLQLDLQRLRDHRTAIFAFFAQEQSLLRQMLGRSSAAPLQPLLDLSLRRLANATDSFAHEEDLLETEIRELQEELDGKL